MQDQQHSKGERLHEIATYNNCILANTLGNHKNSHKWTWHAPNEIHHNQIDYIMIPQHFNSRIKQAIICTIPGADIGSNHYLVSRRPSGRKIHKSSLTWNDIKIHKSQSFPAFTGGKFASLLILEEDVETLTAKFLSATTEAATAILVNY